jgi:hypothetical protein
MIRRLGFCLSTVVPVLVFVLVPFQTVSAQEEVQPSLTPFVEKLVRPYTQYDEYRWASDSLAARGAEAVAPLIEHLHSPSDIVQLRVLGTLSRIGPQSEPALPEFLILLRDKNPAIRTAAAQCIGALGDAGQPALPDLFLALEDRDEITVASAARAIDALQPDFVRSQLWDLLARMGQMPENVRLMPLRHWYQSAWRNVKDPAVGTDLRHWTLVVRFAGYDGVRVTDVLGLATGPG